MSVRSRTHLHFLAYSRPSVRMRKAERGSSSSGKQFIRTKCLVIAVIKKVDRVGQMSGLATNRELARFPLGRRKSGILTLHMGF